MNKRFSILIIFTLSILAFATYPTLVRSESGPKADSSLLTSGNITSDTWDLDKKNRIAVWSGGVHATYEDLTTDCERLEISYNNPTEKDKTEKKQADNGAFGSERIDRIVITGNVKITRTDGSSASAEKVVYDKADGKVILTGNPAVVKLDKSLFQSPRITYDQKKDKISAESSDSIRTNAIIYPKELKGK
jgi:lipopolysaccharide transport protein LptA